MYMIFPFAITSSKDSVLSLISIGAFNHFSSEPKSEKYVGPSMDIGEKPLPGMKSLSMLALLPKVISGSKRLLYRNVCMSVLLFCTHAHKWSTSMHLPVVLKAGLNGFFEVRCQKNWKETNWSWGSDFNLYPNSFVVISIKMRYSRVIAKLWIKLVNDTISLQFL